MSKKKSSWSVDSMLKNAEKAGQSQYTKQSEDFSKVKANTSFTRPASTASVASSSASGVDKNDEDTSSVAQRIKAAGQQNAPFTGSYGSYGDNKLFRAASQMTGKQVEQRDRNVRHDYDIKSNWDKWLQLAQKDTLSASDRAEAKRAAALLSEQAMSLRGQQSTSNPFKYIASAFTSSDDTAVSSADRQKANSYDEIAKMLKARSSGVAAFAAGVAPSWTDKAMKADVAAINKAGYAKASGLDEKSQAAVNNFYSNEKTNLYNSNKTAGMAGGIVGGVAGAAAGIGVADTALGGLKWYANLSKPLQAAVSSGAYFGAQGGASAASQVPSEEEWNTYQAQQQEIATEMGGSYTPQPYDPAALWGNVAKQAGIGAASGAAFGYASAALGDIGKAVLAKHGLQTPFMEAVRNVTAATGGAAASEGVNYAMQSDGQKPTKDEIVQNVATAFLLSALTSGVGAIQTTRANKAAIDYAVQEMQNEYARTFSGTTTRAERAAALDHVTEYNDTIRKAISQHYYAGNQAYINDVLQTLDAIDEQVSRIRASGIADTSIKLPEYRAPAETTATSAVPASGMTAPSAAQSATTPFPVVRPQTSYIQNGVLQEVNRSNVTRMAATLGEHGQKAMMAAYKGSDATAYSGDFIRTYNAGAKGAGIDSVQTTALTPQQKFAAFAAGQNDAPAAQGPSKTEQKPTEAPQAPHEEYDTSTRKGQINAIQKGLGITVVDMTPPAKEEGEKSYIWKAETGKKITVTGYHGEGKPKSEIYNGVNYPIAGQATYYSPSEDGAAQFGGKITHRDVTLESPIVVRDDADWGKLTTAAGWEYSNPYGLSKEDAVKYADSLKEYVTSSGHDGIIVDYEGDMDEDRNIRTHGWVRTLDRTLGGDQIIYYGEPGKQPTATKPAATKPAMKHSDNRSAKEIYEALPVSAKRLINKWAANAWVNIPLANEINTSEFPSKDAVLFVKFFDKWYNAGRNGTSEIDVPFDADTDMEFPNFLSGEFYNQGKKDAEKENAKANSTAAKPAAATAPAEKMPAAEKPSGSPSAQLAGKIQSMIESGKPFNSAWLFEQADKAFGGTQAQGAYTPKDAYDAMELAVNKYLLHAAENMNGDVKAARGALERLQGVLDLLPTQTKRTDEQVSYQQFSTPPTIAYLAAWSAGITPKDTVLEPSAGIGGIAAFPKAWGAKVDVNELSERRLGVLREMGFDGIYDVNAEQLNNMLPDNVQPSVVLMNPPFSSTAGRTTTNKTSNAERHIEQALLRLDDGGRLVAILGKGMADDAPAFSGWWDSLRKNYSIRANIGIDGLNYKKYGTSWGVQLVVIDKTGPQAVETVTGSYKDLTEIPNVMEGIRNDRGTVEAGTVVRSTSGTVGNSGPQQPDVGGTRNRAAGGTGRAGGKIAVSEPAGSVLGDHGREPAERPAGDQLGIQGGGELENGQRVGEGNVPAPSDVSREPSGSAEQPDRPEPKSARPGKVKKAESDDGIYAEYVAPELPVKGAKKHPAHLAESAAMAAVGMPQATYKPNLPKELVSSGALSDAQLTNIVYAGQAHEQKLPDGSRKGYFIGDGTGVGKGRQIAGIILDNMRQGRNKAVWISKGSNLYPDAERDWADIGGNRDDVFNFSKTKLGEKITQDSGILFSSYDTLATEKADKNRLQQIVDWLGKDFDGVIAFDEAHNMGNLLGKQGSRGKTKPAAKALAGAKLQEMLPNARVVYVSATAATDVNELAFAQRLGLWGKGTQFHDVNDFVSKISSGGLAAMELVARDMKSLGVYQARSISFNGVKYDTLMHDLTPMQTQIYNTMCQAWQVTLQNINAALEVTGAQNNGKARSWALSAYYSSMQRFYNQILTSMSMPSVIADMKKELAAGHSCVLQIVNTNQAESDRQLAKAKEEGTELEDLDLTPKGSLLEYLNNSFPVYAYEEYTDDKGNKQSRPVTDKDGNPVIDKQAVAMRDALISQVEEMSVPEGPLEMLFNAFGPDQVAEVTGRSRRIVPREDENGKVRLVEEKRTPKHVEADVQAFQDGKKHILIFSDAGGTGKSYHADRRAKNQEQRIHYLIQAGWSAPKAVQGFGRTHRSNEVSAPVYKLVTTNIRGQKRFISTIARRLDQLGALTKGQRQTGSGMFGEKDNLESDLARDSLRNFYDRLGHNRIDGVDGMDILRKLGLDKKFTDEYGAFKLDDTLSRDMNTFLNRILTLEVDEQNAVFDEFNTIFDTAYDDALKNGTLDLGLENVKADKIEIIDDTPILTDEISGATTDYVQAKTYRKPELLTTVEQLQEWRGGASLQGLYRTDKGDVRAVYRIADKTDSRGNIVKQYRLQGPVKSQFSTWAEKTLAERGNALKKSEWSAAWDKEVEKAPEYEENTVHMLTGTLLPVWNRLPQDHTRVMRIVADDGSQYLGRVIPASQIDDVLARFGGKGRTKETYTPAELMSRILKDGQAVQLTNDRISLSRRRVSGEYRIEVKGQNLWFLPQNYSGIITETINYDRRYFIPTGAAGEKLIEQITQDNPVLSVSEEQDDVDHMLADTATGRWSAPRNSNAVTEKPMPISDIISKARHDFGLPITAGHIRGKKDLGLYFRNSDSIRTKIANDLPTVAHELGHHLDQVYGMTEYAAKDQLSELTDGLSDAMRDAYPEKKWKTEGFAEFLRQYLQSIDETAKKYPKFTLYFLETLSPEDAKNITELADAVNAYYALDKDTAQSSIRFREEQGIDFRTPAEKAADNADHLYQAWVDSNRGIKRFDRAAGANAYMLATNAAYAENIAAAVLEGDLTDQNGQRVGDGLRTVLKDINLKSDVEYRAFGEYLVVKHAPERIKEGMRIFADDRKNSADWCAARQAILEHQYPKFKETSEKLYDFESKFLQTWGVDTGLVSQESTEKWAERWQYYVPLNRDVGSRKTIGARRGFADQNSTIRQAYGSGLDIIHPVDNIMNNMVKMINAGIRNNVMREIATAATRYEGLGIFLEQVDRPLQKQTFDMAGIKEGLNASIENSGLTQGDKDETQGIIGDLDDVLVQYKTGHKAGDVITVLVDGKLQYWKINDPLLMASISNMSPQRLPAFLETLAEFNRFMVSNITGNNVLWSLFSNFPRDFMTAMTFSEDKNPLHMLGGMASAYINMCKGNSADPLFKEYKAMGGTHASVYTADKDFTAQVRKKIRGDDKLKWLNPLNVLEFASDMIETGPRFSYYRILRNKGYAPKEAFYASMDLTTNFRRSGTQARQANKIVPFFNAGVQGLDRFYRWVTGEDTILRAQTPEERAKTARGRILVYLLASAGLAAMMHAVNSKTDDDKKNYAQLSNFTKNSYFCIPIGGGKYFCIPKPRELAVLTSAIEATMDRVGNANEHAFDEFYSYTNDQLLPNVLSDLAHGDIAGAIGSLGVLGVGAYLMANRDFLGRPIVSDSMQSLEPKDQYTARTSKLAYWMGQAFGISPLKVDYFCNNILGGWWKAQKALFPVGGEAEQDKTLGIQGQYIKDNQYSTDVVNRLYDANTEANREAKSNPDDIGAKIAAKWTSLMTGFYSAYNKVAKNAGDSTEQRAARQTVLNMIMEFQKAYDSGSKTGAQKVIESVCKAAGSTEYMPQVMQNSVKDGDGGAHTLTDSMYVDYQTDYLKRYYEYVESVVSTSDDASTQAKACKAAQEYAKEGATNKVLKQLNITTTKQPKSAQLEDQGIDADMQLRYQIALKKYDANQNGHASQEEAENALDSLDLTNEQKSALWQSTSKGWKEKNNPYS